MSGCREKFLRILRLEMEDLEDHILQMIADYREREERHEVTEHVCHGNMAVLGNEDCAVRHFRRVLDTINPDDYGSLDELIRGVSERFDDEVCRAGLSRAACLFAQRKIARVRAYVTHAWDPPGRDFEPLKPDAPSDAREAPLSSWRCSAQSPRTGRARN